MTETKIYTYKEVYTANLKLYADGNVQKSDVCCHHCLGTINKMACINVTNDWDLVSQLARDTEDISLSPGSSLYVASECKTARDTFRNSGYSITRSPEKADAIVVPDVNAKNYYSLEYNVVAYIPAKEELYLFHVDKPGYMITQLTENDLACLRIYLRNNGFEPLEVNREKVKVWFIPKCDEIGNILQNNKIPNKPYIQESRVQIKASTQITPETLVFWENISDRNLLIRTICTSDWMDYPITLLAFLVCFKEGVNWYGYANNDFRRILNSIGYEGFWNPDYVFADGKSITPKDYKMLQSYIFYKLGIAENGGFINAKNFSKIHVTLRKFVNQMIAVKPMEIPVKMTLGQIAALTNNQ